MAALLASKASIDLADNAGVTPLFAVAQKGHDAIVAALLAANASVDGANNKGSTPLPMGLDATTHH